MGECLPREFLASPWCSPTAVCLPVQEALLITVASSFCQLCLVCSSCVRIKTDVMMRDWKKNLGTLSQVLPPELNPLLHAKHH